MRGIGPVERLSVDARQFGGVEREFFAGLATHPEVDAINVTVRGVSEVIHTPGGSFVNAAPGAFTWGTTHIDRQAPQLEVVHVFDETRDEIVSAVEQGKLTFAANVDGDRTTLPVTWTVNDAVPVDIDGNPNDAELTLAANSLSLGRHTIRAEVLDPGTDDVLNQYAYTFDVTVNAPTDLALTGSGTTTTILWTDNSEQETGFEIYRHEVLPYPVLWYLVGSTDADMTSFVDTTASGNSDYEYVVRSVGYRDRISSDPRPWRSCRRWMSRHPRSSCQLWPRMPARRRPVSTPGRLPSRERGALQAPDHPVPGHWYSDGGCGLRHLAWPGHDSQRQQFGHHRGSADR